MGAQPALLEHLRAQGFVPLPSDDATRAFEHALSFGAAQVVIMDRDTTVRTDVRSGSEVALAEASSVTQAAAVGLVVSR